MLINIHFFGLYILHILPVESALFPFRNFLDRMPATQFHFTAKIELNSK